MGHDLAFSASSMHLELTTWYVTVKKHYETCGIHWLAKGFNNKSLTKDLVQYYYVLAKDLSADMSHTFTYYLCCLFENSLACDQLAMNTCVSDF